MSSGAAGVNERMQHLQSRARPPGDFALQYCSQARLRRCHAEFHLEDKSCAVERRPVCTSPCMLPLYSCKQVQTISTVTE